jgi:hypothetical protein
MPPVTFVFQFASAIFVVLTLCMAKLFDAQKLPVSPQPGKGKWDGKHPVHRTETIAASI